MEVVIIRPVDGDVVHCLEVEEEAGAEDILDAAVDTVCRKIKRGAVRKMYG